MRKICLLFILFLGLFAYAAAQDSLAKRPKVGLVLSGGSAKGFAHIGLLKVLDQAGVKIDYITGTSMGSIIGALFAIGYTPHEIEQLVLSTNWDELVYDKTSQRSISIEEKDEFSKYVGELAIVKGKFILPKGMIVGQKLSLMLAHLTWSVHNVNDFDDFQIPFRCISTNIETGEAVVHSRGYLPDALRASMAIPTIYTPMEIDGKLLVDGMLARNLPASDAIDMGADIIIGSDVGAPLYKKEELTSMFEIIDQASSFRGAAVNIKQQKLCNYLVLPDVSGFTTTSFDQADSLIARGQRAALKLLPQFKKLAEQQAHFDDYHTKPTPPAFLHSLNIGRIEIEGLDKVSKNVVLAGLDIKENDLTELTDIEKGIERIYGTQFFERVNYRIKRDVDVWVLVIRVIERTQNLFRFSINYDNDLNAALLLNGTFRNILGEGSKLLIDLKLSENLAARASYSIFTRWKPSIGFKTNFTYNQFVANIYQNNQSILSLFNVSHYVLDLSVASSISNSALLYTGLVGEITQLSTKIGSTDTLDLSSKILSYQLIFRKDNYDKAVYPNTGSAIRIEIRTPLKSMYSDTNPWDKSYWRISGSYQRIFPVSKRFSIISSLNTGMVLGQNVNYTQLFYLGGRHPFESNIFPFTGLKFMGKPAKNFIYNTSSLQFEPFIDKYISIRGSIGNVSENTSHLFDFEDMIAGYGFSVGWNTVIGPIEFSLNRSNLSKVYIKEVKIGYFF